MPFARGLSDERFLIMYKRVLDRTLAVYQPDAIWMQCGADSLKGDTIGSFNLTIKGHSSAVEYTLGKNLPIIYSGGGGYHVDNVARCWAYETMVISGIEDDTLTIPEKSKYKAWYESPDLLYTRENVHGIKRDLNTDQDCHHLLSKVFGIIDKIDGSIPFLDQMIVPGKDNELLIRAEEFCPGVSKSK